MALADDLVAVHSTDPATVYLSLLARMQRPDLDAVERALYTDRALVRHHSLRRTRVLLELGMEGAITRARPVGSWINGQYTWTPTLDWLGEEIAGLDVAAAERELTGAYLRSFGPVTTTDVRWWAGWTATTARRALAAAGAVAIDTDDGPAWVAPGDEAPDEPVDEWVALLPSLDSTLMGWKERAWYLPASSADAFDSIGNGGPTVWVDGVVVGAWAQRPDGEIRVHWFQDVPAGRRAQVADRARELEGWLGETRFTARFPGAITASLLA